LIRNLALPRELYGDEVLGKQTLRLLEIADEPGCWAKLRGSGSPVVGLAPEDGAAWKRLVAAYEGGPIQRCIMDL